MRGNLNHLWADPTLSPAERLVLIYLIDRQGRNRDCWPTTNTIATQTGLSRASVSRALHSLVSGNRITRSRSKYFSRYSIKTQLPHTEASQSQLPHTEASGFQLPHPESSESPKREIFHLSIAKPANIQLPHTESSAKIEMPHTETRVASHRGIEQYQEQNTKKGRTKRPPSSLSNNHEKDPGQEVISHYFLKYEERFHEKPKPPTWSGKRDAPILRNHTKEHGKTKMLKVIDLFIKDDSKKMIREAGHTIRMLSYFLPGYVEEINNPKEDRSGIPDLPKLL